MKRFLVYSLAVFSAILCGCSEDDSLRKDLDTLKSRVDALETQVNALNGNVSSLQALHQSGASITDVTLSSDGVYTITMSNGESFTLTQGSEAPVPLVEIDAQGFWTISYDGGETYARIQYNGQDAKATAVTPLFRVSDAGNWQVSYDDGATYADVKDQAGQSVGAFGSVAPNDKFFESVALEDDVLVIKLWSGETIEVPVMKNFLCVIDLDGATPPIRFTSGQTKTFNVSVKGVENIFITAPDKWTAKISEPSGETETTPGTAVLTVTAPISVASGMAPAGMDVPTTRASADNTMDIALLATSGRFCAISKLVVEPMAGYVAPPTVESVTYVEGSNANIGELEFTVALSSDATGWKYMVKETSEAAPPVTDIASGGTAMPAATTSLKLTGLAGLTEYKLYVVAYAGTTDAVYSDTYKSAAGTTRSNVIDYWEEGITINGVVYDKNTTGVELLTIPAGAAADVTFGGTVGTARVVFLEKSLSATYNYKIATKLDVRNNLILVGRYSDQKPVLKCAVSAAPQVTINNANTVAGATFALVNLAIENGVGYFANVAGPVWPVFIMQDCRFDSFAALFYYGNTGSIMGIDKFVFKNNIMKMTASYAPILFNLGSAVNPINYRDIEISNNIFYPAPGVTASASSGLINLGSGATLAQTASDVWNGKIKITNNTTYGIPFGNGIVRYVAAGELDISKNIIALGTQSGNAYLYLEFRAKVTLGTANDPNPVNLTGNVGYGGSGNLDFYGTGSTLESYDGASNTLAKTAVNPLETADAATGVFKRNAAMKAAGTGSSLCD